MAKKKKPELTVTDTSAADPAVEETPTKKPDDRDWLEVENGNRYRLTRVPEDLLDRDNWTVETDGKLPTQAGQLRVHVNVAGQVYSAIAAPHAKPDLGLRWQGLTPLQWKPFKYKDLS